MYTEEQNNMNKLSHINDTCYSAVDVVHALSVFPLHCHKTYTTTYMCAT